MLLTLIAFLFILSVLVLIHEAGHYFVAKKLGIKVEEFGFGLPLTKAIYSFKRGETIYSIYPALIGGFVKLYGEDEAGSGKIAVKDESATISKKSDAHRAFFSRSIGQRAAVVVAGVVMNTLLAIVIYYGFMLVSNFRTELPLIGNFHFFLVDQSVKTQVIVNQVEKNSPAAQAKIEPFSQITALNGHAVGDLKSFTQEVKANEGKVVTVAWQNIETGRKSSAQIIPRVPGKNQGALGVGIFSANTVVLSYDTPVQRLLSGITHPANLMAYNFYVLGSLIGVSVKEKNVSALSQSVSGPVGIYSLVGTIVHIPEVKERWLETLNLVGLLSISLAFFNVLPIPGLDGGRLFFIVIEAVIRKKLNPKFEGYANAIGMAILIGLILLITVKDIFQQFSK